MLEWEFPKSKFSGSLVINHAIQYNVMYLIICGIK